MQIGKEGSMMTIYERFPMKDQEGDYIVAVAYPHDVETLKTLQDAFKKNILTKAFLCGDETIIRSVIQKNKLKLPNVEFVHCATMEEAADMTARLIFENKAHAPMKGLLDTSIFLKPMLKKEYGLRTGRAMASVSLAYREKDGVFYIISDAAMNIAPTIQQKKDIIVSCVELANALGIDNPVVVPLTAKEKVYDKMPATLEAEELHQMNLRGEILNCQVSGPLALDLAVSEKSAKMKSCKDPLAGKAQILLVPDIEAGNIFAKALTYLADFIGYGVILGAKVPMIITSRSDGEDEKLGSMYLARLIFEKEKHHV